MKGKNSINRKYTRNVIYRPYVFLLLLLSVISVSYAQNYPLPGPISPLNLDQLLLKLKNSPLDRDKITTLLGIGNYYYNKPIRVDGDMDKGLYYSKIAKELSQKIHDDAAFNDASLLIADLFLEKNDYGPPEAILNVVNDTTQLKLLLTLSWKSINKIGGNEDDNPKICLAYAERARTLAKQLHMKLYEILTLKYMGDAHGNMRKYKLAETEFNEALTQYKAIGYKNLHYIYAEQTCMYEGMGDQSKALEAITLTINSMKATRDYWAAGDFYTFYGSIFWQSGQMQKALDSYNMAIHYFKIHSGVFSASYCTTRIVEIYNGLKQYEKALSYLKANEIATPPQNYLDERTVANAFGNCYMKLNRPDLAEGFYKQLMTIDKKYKRTGSYPYRRLGLFYTETRQYQKAKPYLLYAEAHYGILATDLGVRGKIQHALFLVDSASADYLSAIKHQTKQRLFDDSLYNLKKIEEQQKLISQYETSISNQQKNAQITAFKQSEKLQTASLNEATLIKNAALFGTVMLFIAFGVFYRQYRQKKRTGLLITKRNKQLNHLLSEKEWLLKEVHHRVKNNLHTVISLLEIQAEFLKDDALKAIENSQHRIYAMSLIHQKLYNSDDVKTINMAEYLPELISYLKDSFEDVQQIRYDLDIQPVQLDVSQAMPLGLIINEAVTNAIKYAFPTKKCGIIAVKIHKKKDEVVLTIADNGIGFSKELESVKESSLGLKLIRGLSEDINAQIFIKHDKGTTITLAFNPKFLEEVSGVLLPSVESEVNFES